MSKIDLSGKIERLEAFEEKHKVHIENASAWFDDSNGWVSVLFELHSETGTTLSKDLKVIIAVYNPEGQIVETIETLHQVEKFWGFGLCNRSVGEIPLKDVAKIRIYPIAW